MEMEFWGHSVGRTADGMINGDSIGDMVDQIIKGQEIDPEVIRGVEIHVNGRIIRLRKPDTHTGGRT